MHRYTGGDSNININNLQHLVNTEKDFIIRIPLISGVTDTDENISDIISLFKKPDIKYAEAMPYNNMAGAKYPLAGRVSIPEYDHNAKVQIPSEAFEKTEYSSAFSKGDYDFAGYFTELYTEYQNNTISITVLQ